MCVFEVMSVGVTQKLGQSGSWDDSAGTGQHVGWVVKRRVCLLQISAEVGKDNGALLMTRGRTVGNSNLRTTGNR